MQQIKLTKEFIDKNLIRSDGHLNVRKFHFYTQDGINRITKEEIYCGYHTISPIICANPECNNIAVYKDFVNGYRRTCSQKCAGQDPERLTKIEETCKKRYGSKSYLGYHSKEAKKQRIRSGAQINAVDYKLYKKSVWKTTNNQPLFCLENIDKRGRGGYHLDHKYSINEGFINNILPHIVGNINNLEMLAEFDNISKHSKSSGNI